MNAYMEGTIQVRKDVIEMTNGDNPFAASSRKMDAIWGESNRSNPFAVLDDWTNLSERRRVQERYEIPCEGSKELPIGGRAIDMTLLSP